MRSRLLHIADDIGSINAVGPAMTHGMRDVRLITYMHRFV